MSESGVAEHSAHEQLAPCVAQLSQPQPAPCCVKAAAASAKVKAVTPAARTKVRRLSGLSTIATPAVRMFILHLTSGSMKLCVEMENAKE